MTTQSPAEPVPHFTPTATEPAETLLQQVTEQVMRCTDDEAAVFAFDGASPGTPAAAAALGRLLSTHAIQLVAGCPLMAFVTGTEPDPHWRAAYPPRPSSLFAEFEFLQALYGPGEGDPFEALATLRLRAEEELGC
jgi:hypothetical protein